MGFLNTDTMAMNEQAIRICEIEGFLPYMELSAVGLSWGQVLITKNVLSES